MNNLRRRGQSLCDHKDTDEGRRVYVQQTVRETEEQWRTVLQAAKQIKAAAEAQITEETERRELEVSVNFYYEVCPVPLLIQTLRSTLLSSHCGTVMTSASSCFFLFS